MDASTESTDTAAKPGVRSGTARAATAAAKTAAKRTVTKKAAANKTVARKTASKTVAKKTVAKKTAATKQTVTKQTVAKQTTATKTVAKKAAPTKTSDPVPEEPPTDANSTETAPPESAPTTTTPADGAGLDEETRERTMGPVRAYETPIFAAMFSGWDGPAAGMISRNLHRADDDTMVFDTLMWRPSPDSAAPALRFHVGGDRHAPVVTVTGELKPGSIALLTTPLRHILRRRPRQMIVDLFGITAASPAALRSLLDVRQAARAAHVDFWLRSPTDDVRELLKPDNAQVAVRPKGSAERRPTGSVSKRDKEGDAAGVAEHGNPQTAPTPQAGAGAKERAVAAKVSRVYRRASAADSRVLEGVVVQGPATRARPWWSSHALRESLRRVGTHQHAPGHGSSV